MLGNHPFVAPLEGVLARVRDWPVTAQQQARRNAMVAATACTQRRIEREEVADFLRTKAEAPAAPTETRTAAEIARAHG